jgi:protease I
MADTLQGKKIALLATSGFEDSELTRPLEAVEAAGGEVVVISEQGGTFTGEHGTEVPTDKTVDDASADDYDGLLLPGGVANPDKMRMNKAAVDFVRAFFDKQKPVAAICHAPWLLIEAGVVEGKQLTSWPSLRTDLINAGAEWIDEEVVTDENLVTSRKPDDLDQFCAQTVRMFADSGSSAA